jgi:hypothetical protein
MKQTTGFPKTFLHHPNQWRFKALLDDLFSQPHPEQITEAVISFFKKHPLPLDDFPVLKNTYSRTLLARHENGYEAMAARWDKGTVSSIHGHPDYSFLITVHGRLQIDNYEKSGSGLQKTSTRVLMPGQFVHATAHNNHFDNHIHGVKAIEETLSIHLSSRDASTGEVFHLAG